MYLNIFAIYFSIRFFLLFSSTFLPYNTVSLLLIRQGLKLKTESLRPDDAEIEEEEETQKKKKASKKDKKKKAKLEAKTSQKKEKKKGGKGGEGKKKKSK